MLKSREQQHKLVTAQARDGVCGSNTRQKPLSDLLQQLITDLMPVLVIHRFEAIEIHVANRCHGVPAIIEREGLAHAVRKQQAIG